MFATENPGAPDPLSLYRRYRRALDGASLPAAFVDLDALDENIDRLIAPVRAANKTLRLATKSIRCPDVIQHILARGAGVIRGLMTYTAYETASLVEAGHRDLLLAYPTLQAADLARIAEANRIATAAITVDCLPHLEAAARAAAAAGTIIPIVVDVDLSYRPFAGGPHLGVRRSPLRTAKEVVSLVEQAARFSSLRFHGLLGYEAQIAGLGDSNPFTRTTNFAKRSIKSLSAPRVRAVRADCVAALSAHSFSPTIVNGGGTGSLAFSAADPALTEVTAGSGFLGSLLFDYYRDLTLSPALAFALEVTRNPAPLIFTCHGGGYVASGEAGPDRLPRPWLPPGLSLLGMEGAGEVQTPIRVPANSTVQLGDPVLFRHAKAGELAEHFNEYLLVRGDRVISRAKTYRGLGHAFIG